MRLLPFRSLPRNHYGSQRPPVDTSAAQRACFGTREELGLRLLHVAVGLLVVAAATHGPAPVAGWWYLRALSLVLGGDGLRLVRVVFELVALVKARHAHHAQKLKLAIRRQHELLLA